MRVKTKVMFFIYILLIILCSIIKINFFQNIVAICASILLVFVLSNKFEVKDIKFKLLCMFIVLLSIALILFNYYSSIKLGYQDGLVLGQIGDFAYDDTWNYYYESKYLHELWKNGQFKFWLTGSVEKGNAFYGYYNFFVIWNAVLRMIFGENLNLFIIIKYQFSIIATFFLYKIARCFLEAKYARYAVVLMAIFPGYLLTNITLMRDNIIVFFIIYACYLVIINKTNDAIFSKKLWIKILMIVTVATYLRVYSGIILVVSLLTYYLLGKLNFKRLVIVSVILSIGTVLIGIILEKMGYGFLGKNLILNPQSLSRWNPDKISSPVKYIFWTLYYTFFGVESLGKPTLYIGNVLNSIAPFCVAVYIVPTLFIIFIKINNKQFKYFISFVFLFSILSAGSAFFIFTGIVPRLYGGWIWSQIIILSYIIQRIGICR